MTKAKRGKSALSRHLAQRTAERAAQRDQPDASASPVEEKPVPQIEVAPEPVAEVPTVVEPAPKLKTRRKAMPVRKPKAAKAPVVEPAVVERPVVEEPAVAEPEPARGPVPLRPKAKATKARPGDPIKVVKPSKLTPFVGKIGVLTDAEVARMAGVTATNVQLWRRRRGIPPARDARSAAPVVEAPASVQPVTEPVQAAPVEAPVPVAGEPKPSVRPASPGTLGRTVRLTDRVEGMLQALAKARGIDLDDAISVAIAQDYLRCQAIVQGE